MDNAIVTLARRAWLLALQWSNNLNPANATHTTRQDCLLWVEVWHLIREFLGGAGKYAKVDHNVAISCLPQNAKCLFIFCAEWLVGNILGWGMWKCQSWQLPRIVRERCAVHLWHQRQRHNFMTHHHSDTYTFVFLHDMPDFIEKYISIARSLGALSSLQGALACLASYWLFSKAFWWDRVELYARPIRHLPLWRCAYLARPTPPTPPSSSSTPSSYVAVLPPSSPPRSSETNSMWTLPYFLAPPPPLQWWLQ